ncbi:MAG: right-handed parallel beta-helix repeat-containing protein [Saprospiraceae bacterium]|nr:right-handed parallel beta-helix repeat-containing protein [Saprospiraceae bacterium]
MKKQLLVAYLFFIYFGSPLVAQTFYVDAQHGNDLDEGTESAPFQSLEYAVNRANTQTGNTPIVIKVMPGIYLLQDKISINPVKITTKDVRFIIEAAVMPDDDEWSPEAMPVIQSISGINSTTQFPHATGILVASNHVTIQGLKFLGNANPQVDYYYPISKEDPDLSDMVISQCYFIGDKESAKIQGGIWAHGRENVVSHCIFYECRNGVLFFYNVDRFVIEHSIIYGAYESAFWFGPQDYPFTFTNNIIANNANFLVGPEDLEYSASFSNSIIANNEGYVGYWSRAEQKIKQISSPNITLDNTLRSGEIQLITNYSVKLTKEHLQLTPGSQGRKLHAGIFKKD